MNLDTQIFLLIGIGGVVLIWSFRKTSGTKQEIKEIEYLAFASIWGILLVVSYHEISELFKSDISKDVLNNPLVGAVVFSVLGSIVGSLFGMIDRRCSIRQKLVNSLKCAERKYFE